MDAPLKSETDLLSGKKLWLVFAAFIATFSMMAVDQTILSTALPTIASHFNAISDLPWIASGYFLTQAGFMLFFGRVLAITPAKATLIVSIGIFELGSLLCAVAPSVQFLIFARALAGIGGAGLWIAIMAIIARITTMGQRPIILAIFGAVFAISSIVGPLLGGALTDRASWRWCFYINLPIGAVSLVTVILFLPELPSPTAGVKQWLKLDWLGTFLSIAFVTCVLLPLQWGGNTKPWNDKSVIALLVLSFVLLLVFLAWEYKQGDNAILPLALFLERSFLGACIEILLLGVGFVIATYYLPFFYQIRGHSAEKSGLLILPFMGAGVVATLLAGAAVSVMGQPWPFLFTSPLLACVAFCLLFTVTQTTSAGKIYGYQILLAVGLGPAIQNLTVIAQSTFASKPKLLPQAISMITFMQLIGNSIGLASAGAVFHNQLIAKLHILAPNLSPELTQAVLSNIQAIFHLPPDEMSQVMNAYGSAVNYVFLIGVPASALASLTALIIKRERIVVVADGAGGAVPAEKKKSVDITEIGGALPSVEVVLKDVEKA